MAKKELLIPVRMTGEVFREFAVFDAMVRQKRWRGPLAFALVFSVFSAICYTQAQRLQGAWLLGTVLLAVGLGLPAAYFANFFLSVKTQGNRLGGKNAPIAYTVRLREEGVLAEQGKDRMELEWGQLYAAVRLEHSVCVYVTQRQAYLLPGEAGEKEGREIWDWVLEHMPQEKRTDRVKG